jgi:hypothetical protein
VDNITTRIIPFGFTDYDLKNLREDTFYYKLLSEFGENHELSLDKGFTMAEAKIVDYFAEDSMESFVAVEVNTPKSQKVQIQSDKLKMMFQEDSVPDSLYFAYSLFEEVWQNSPSDMKKPTKPQLIKYMEDKGIKEQTNIDAIIRVSTPNGISFGGKQKPELKSWVPKSERNKTN